MKTAVVEDVKKQEGLALNPQTTFLGIIELHDRFIFTYVGDGAIILYRAAADTCGGFVIPHSAPLGLTRFLAATDQPPKHAYMEVDKALEGGEIVVAGTDGALPLGRTYAVSGEVLKDLKREFVGSGKDFNTQAHTVREFLEKKVKDEFKTDDNRTLGIILTGRALISWQED